MGRTQICPKSVIEKRPERPGNVHNKQSEADAHAAMSWSGRVGRHFRPTIPFGELPQAATGDWSWPMCVRTGRRHSCKLRSFTLEPNKTRKPKTRVRLSVCLSVSLSPCLFQSVSASVSLCAPVTSPFCLFCICLLVSPSLSLSHCPFVCMFVCLLVSRACVARTSAPAYRGRGGNALCPVLHECPDSLAYVV